MQDRKNSDDSHPCVFRPTIQQENAIVNAFLDKLLQFIGVKT